MKERGKEGKDKEGKGLKGESIKKGIRVASRKKKEGCRHGGVQPSLIL